MPTYAYKCEACGYEWEENLRMSENDKPLKERCPNSWCGAEGKVRQVITTYGGLADPYRMGRIKPDGQWREFTQKLKKNNPGSANFNTWD